MGGKPHTEQTTHNAHKILFFNPQTLGSCGAQLAWRVWDGVVCYSCAPRTGVRFPVPPKAEFGLLTPRAMLVYGPCSSADLSVATPGPGHVPQLPGYKLPCVRVSAKCQLCTFVFVVALH